MNDPMSFIYQINHISEDIKLPWIESKKDPLFEKYGFHTGIDICADTVYSLLPGNILNIGTDGKFYAVTIQYNGKILLRYLHLDTISIYVGQIVQSGFQVGIAHKFVHFELITSDRNNSNLPVRINTETYYKQNPFEIYNYLNLDSEDSSSLFD